MTSINSHNQYRNVSKMHNTINALTRANQILQCKLLKIESMSDKKQKKMNFETQMRLTANKEKFELKQKLQKLQKCIAAKLNVLGIDFSEITDTNTALNTAFNIIQKLAKELEQKEEEINHLNTQCTMNTIKELRHNQINLNSKINSLEIVNNLLNNQLNDKEIEINKLKNIKKEINNLQIKNKQFNLNNEYLNEMKMKDAKISSLETALNDLHSDYENTIHLNSQINDLNDQISSNQTATYNELILKKEIIKKIEKKRISTKEKFNKLLKKYKKLKLKQDQCLNEIKILKSNKNIQALDNDN